MHAECRGDAGPGALLGARRPGTKDWIAGAAVLLGHLDAEDAQLAELAVEVAGHRPRATILLGRD